MKMTVESFVNGFHFQEVALSLQCSTIVRRCLQVTALVRSGQELLELIGPALVVPFQGLDDQKYQASSILKVCEPSNSKAG
jgi:hypothetical protein